MNDNKNIISIGGVGGSGTRVIAQILRESGYFMGSDLNESNDTLLFTLLFKRENILTLTDEEFDYNINIFIKVMSKGERLTEPERLYVEGLAAKDRTLHNKEWLSDRLKYLSNNIEDIWGWKEPNTHIVIEKLFHKIDNLKFVYVYRNGLDMAYSTNQNQLKLWGNIFLNDKSIEITPKNSLKYWCVAHKRVSSLQRTYPDKIHMLDFDKLCHDSEGVLKELSTFIGSGECLSKYKELIKTPASVGRYKEYSLEDFNKNDIDYISTIYDI